MLKGLLLMKQVHLNTNNPYANSGIVVGLDYKRLEEDFDGKENLAALALQQS